MLQSPRSTLQIPSSTAIPAGITEPSFAILGGAIKRTMKSGTLVFLGLGVPSAKVSWQAEHNIVTTGRGRAPPPHVSRHMRDQLGDPDSLRVVSFFYYEPSAPDSHYLCVVFRAKNEHGGLVLQNYANNAVDDSPGGFNNDLVWSVICKGSVVLDATEAVKAALKADREKE